MSVVRYHTYENKLARLLSTPGGKSVDAAVADAEAELGSITDSCLAEIARRLKALAAAPAQPAPDAVAGLYADAREIVSLAGVCGLEAAGTAASSLCAFLDHAQGGGAWMAEAFRVHVDALQVLCAPETADSPLIRAEVLAGLQRMVTRLAGTETRHTAAG